MESHDLTQVEQSRYEKGEAMRRQVLGDEHVNRSLGNATAFSKPLQELVTEYCWGYLWNRDTISLRERSFINLGMITALGKMEELALHVKGAINNGLTPEEIREALLQTTIYCGVPAALEATRTAQRVLTEMGIDTHE
ncbi:carboxymuconolactone decarboxylase family protein [Pseudarthrobacter niigatensis]|uniref:4-carboxymuconolactone decarboxylase n=1 Tax=Pseudarthrobacter niigatensis TaxID=369935 RepID=A0AAJ1WC48_9MICC|nr:carboxymuconolactone decarboxylase family protein [Pseudarthrobacter niigatensis]MDQ0144659.1 4-carboxymuconolactone decarboxylase [Pseudarthrobacter niigatensis]MDQ0265305.1 4-carboxymuconolactone decarboxylase [Pseudarthrobacter niigatensis]